MKALDLFQDDSLDLEPPSLARRLLFRDSPGPGTPAEVVRWWEQRRLPFNIAVGATGVTSIAFLTILGAIGPYPYSAPGPPLIAVLIYGLGANVAFTSGWLLELFLLRPLFGRRSGTVGAALFRYGLAFSVGLTALPIGIASISFGARVVRWLLGLGPS